MKIVRIVNGFPHISWICTIIFALLVFKYNNSEATNYYLSDAGDDNNSGTSSSHAWKSIDKLNAMMATVKPGDTIYFRTGDTFIGQINLTVSGSSGKAIVFNSYGSGENASISACLPIGVWTNFGKNIWRVPVPTKVSQVFENNRRLPVGRFPNTGYLRTDNEGTRTSFFDAALKKSRINFAGSNVVLQNTDYHWESKLVATYSSGNFTLASSVNSNISKDQGYYLINKLDFLDVKDEWYYDETSGYLYLFSTVNPTGRNISASVYDYGIKGSWNRNNIHVLNLNFAGQSLDGLWLRGAGCNNNIINNCTYDSQRRYAVSLMGENIIVRNNIFRETGGIATEVTGANNIVIENNQYKRIGLNTSVITGSVGELQAIRVWDSFNSKLRNNLIDSIGYNGITCNSGNGIISNNIVTNTLLIASDGGGIYCWSNKSNNMNFENNIVDNVFGNVEARPAGTSVFKSGIYLDNGVYNCVVKNNTVMSAGLRSNAGTSANSFIGNVVYKSDYGLNFSEWYAGPSVLNMICKGNIFYTNVAGGIPLLIESEDNHYDVFSASDSNYYCNPYSENVVQYKWHTKKTFSLSNWQQETGLDAHSKKSTFQWEYPTDKSFIIVNKTNQPLNYTLGNGVFDLDNNPKSEVVIPPFSSQIFVRDNFGNQRFYSHLENNYEVKLYPNPANNYVHIESEKEISEIILTDASGLILFKSSNQNMNLLDVSGLANGVYYISIIAGDKTTQQKIFKY
ncbi:MAG: T9SS type A sorting domain-containing protein [Cytophagaceae bacterium]